MRRFRPSSIPPSLKHATPIASRASTLPFILVVTAVIYLSRKYKACHYRIPLTYLLLALSVATVVQAQAWIPPGWALQHRGWLFPVFFVAIALIFAVHLMRANSPIKAAAYLLFILSMAFIISPLMQIAHVQGVLKSSLATVIGLFMALSLVALWRPEWIRLDWGPFLFFGLVGLLLMRLSFWIWSPSIQTIRISAYIGIVLFSAYVLYDTKLMTMRANQCDKTYDYVTNLIGLFIDFMNMFSDTMTLSSTRG